MLMFPADYIADALRAANTNRVTATCAKIAGLYCELLADGTRTDRYISLGDTEPYATITQTAVHCPIYDGELPQCEADDDDMVDASYRLLAALLAEWGGKLCLRDGTELRDATPEEIAESWIVGGSGMIEAMHDGLTVIAYVEAA